MSQINDLKGNIYNLQERNNENTIPNPFNNKSNNPVVISNDKSNSASVISNNTKTNTSSIISTNSTNNNNKDEHENNDYFDKQIVKHAPIKRQALTKRSSLLDTEDLVSELKNENKELQKNIEILKKKLSQGIQQASKDMEFNISKSRNYRIK